MGQGPGLGVMLGVVPPFGVVVGLAGVVVDVDELGCVAVLDGKVGVGAGAAMAVPANNPPATANVKISLRMANLPCPVCGPMGEKRARGETVACRFPHAESAKRVSPGRRLMWPPACRPVDRAAG